MFTEPSNGTITVKCEGVGSDDDYRLDDDYISPSSDFGLSKYCHDSTVMTTIFTIFISI